VIPKQQIEKWGGPSIHLEIFTSLLHFVFTEWIDLANYFMVQARLCFHVANQLVNPLKNSMMNLFIL
jgi:hypothetical protein